MSHKLTVTIDCEGELFQNHRGEFSPEPELAYILVQFATKTLGDGMLRPRNEVHLYSSKRVRVGSARLTE